jgi:competence protein ComEC
MVVLSGYNITIVALSIMWLFSKFLSKRTSIIAGVISIILFAMMVGGGATVVRASVMAILGLLAQASGRTSQVARALVIAALLMVAINPKLLVFDIGFQLSFLATLGLIYLEPIFKPHFTWLPERLAWLPIREIASATLGAQLAVFPLILYTFGNFSVYAFPVNMLVLPLVPTAMLLVFLVGILVPIPLISLLAWPIAWITYALLAYMIGLVRLVSHLPFASLQFDNVPLAIVLILYAFIVFLVIKFHKKEQHLATRSPSA